MSGLPDYFYDVNLFSVTFRLFLAMVFGGIIGLERGASRHPAGFRTFMLVCMGATLAMLTNQFITETFDAVSDPSRMGAQVITGVGFLGVGTIWVTGGHKIKGLTTAAGLWASACIGLAIGIGFYSGAVITGLLVFLSLGILSKVERYFYNLSRVMDLYVELESLSKLKEFHSFIKSTGITILETYLGKSDKVTTGAIGLHISVKIPKDMNYNQVIELLNQQEGVFLIEEI